MDKKSIVTKSNELNEARYNLSTSEQKLILTVVSMIQPQDEDFKIYKLHIQDFMDLFDLKSKGNYARIKEKADDLLKKTIHIYENDQLIITHWFSSTIYKPNSGEILFKFDPALKPYFIQLKNRFISYRLKNILYLKSSYSIRLYELLKQYEKIGKRVFTIEYLRELFGIKKDEYSRYSDFKKIILKTPQKELAEKTDISFEFDEIKEGRKIAKIIFYIKKSKKNKISKIEIYCQENNLPDSIKNEMLKKVKLGLSEDLIIEKTIKEYNL